MSLVCGVVAVVLLFSGWFANVILAGGITVAVYQRLYSVLHRIAYIVSMLDLPISLPGNMFLLVSTW